MSRRAVWRIHLRQSRRRLAAYTGCGGPASALASFDRTYRSRPRTIPASAASNTPAPRQREVEGELARAVVMASTHAAADTRTNLRAGRRKLPCEVSGFRRRMSRKRRPSKGLRPEPEGNAQGPHAWADLGVGRQARSRRPWIGPIPEFDRVRDTLTWNRTLKASMDGPLPKQSLALRLRTERVIGADHASWVISSQWALEPRSDRMGVTGLSREWIYGTAHQGGRVATRQGCRLATR